MAHPNLGVGLNQRMAEGARWQHPPLGIVEEISCNKRLADAIFSESRGHYLVDSLRWLNILPFQRRMIVFLQLDMLGSYMIKFGAQRSPSNGRLYNKLRQSLDSVHAFLSVSPQPPPFSNIFTVFQERNLDWHGAEVAGLSESDLGRPEPIQRRTISTLSGTA